MIRPFWDGSFSIKKGVSMIGRIEVITGCMFSGKTEELIRRLHQLQFAKQHYLLFKPAIDDRYGKLKVKTHYGRELDAWVLIEGQESIEGMVAVTGKEAFDKADVIAFDETNFFSKDLPKLCESLTKLGKRVIVSGLDRTFLGDPFIPMPDLLALADSFIKLNAVCVICGKPATRTQRLIDGNPAPRDDVLIKVGGKGEYEARCPDCYKGG